MRLRQGPIAVLLLVPAGVLAGHAFGYAAAGHVHGGLAATAGHSHGYLGVAAAVAFALALVALAGAAAGLGGSFRMPSLPRIAALQCGVLLLQEGVEHALAGHPVGTLVTAWTLWLSLAGQLVAVAGACLLLRSARLVGGRLALLPGRALPVVLARSGTAPSAGTSMPPRARPGALVARGPPAAA